MKSGAQVTNSRSSALLKSNSDSFFRKVVRSRTLLLMLAPAVLFYLIFLYLPMTGIVIAFKDFNYSDGIFGSPWIGFKNFKFFFMTGAAKYVTINTLVYNAVFLINNTIWQVLVAIFLSEISRKLFKKVAQSMMFLPYFISWVVAGAIVYNLFNYEYGSLNTMLKSMHMSPINVYADVGIWKYKLVIASSWKWVGYGSVIFLAAIMGIDLELYEAAFIDGANIFQKIRYITIPLLVPQIVILTLLHVGRIFRGDFEMFYQVTGNNPIVYQATDVIDTYVFRSLLDLQDFGMSASVGVYQSVLCFAILMLTNFLVKRYQSDYALF